MSPYLDRKGRPYEFKMTYTQIIKQLKSKRNARNIAGMARFGINPKNTLGISIPTLRALAKEIGSDHALALIFTAAEAQSRRVLQPVRWVRKSCGWFHRAKGA